MGNYNPHAPYILGQEWVPIRDEELRYSPNVNAVELGTTYTQAGAGRIRSARFYVNDPQPTVQGFQVAMVGLYPSGYEDRSGPISQVIIPCTAGTTTGSAISFAGGAANMAEALYTPGDGKALEFDYNSGSPQDASFWFDVASYPVLNGKRILNVALLYAGSIFDIDPEDASQPFTTFVDPDQGTGVTVIRQRNDLGTSITFSGPAFFSNAGSLSDLSFVPSAASNSPQQNQVIGALNLGDINNYWSATLGPSGTTDKMPWRYDELLRFQQNYGAGRQHIWLRVQLPATPWTEANPGTVYPSLWLEYLALRVIYCEETRVAYGGRRFAYTYGMNDVPLRDLAFNADPIVAAGTYVPTLSWVSAGQVDYGQTQNGDFPGLNAVRELYQIPSHPGVQVDVPFPVEESLGEVFTSTVTHILPQLSLHASGGTLTEPHVYGRQVAAQVYGSNTATQDIYDDISGVSASYPQVRFYARRFGDTTVPLTLTGVGGLSGSTVSITVDEFDALQKILDGWAEVTLRFASPPSMGAVAGNPAWVWSAAGESAGNRWEILGASAPAISGVPGSYYTAVPSPNALGSATYQPPSGSTVELTWMPQGVGTPWVTGASADTTSDAVLIFSQDPPTVTGVALTAQTQTVTGIGLDCGSLPCCIPSGIAYQQVTWSATTLPTTGFGAYELQRFDYLDETGDFQTIMFATSPTVTGFNDFEARVGITSVYRIRTLNVLNFAGEWSTYVSGAPPEPGVTGGCSDATGALIFTSNADQSGASNAAYVMQWDGSPTEDFALPEADMVAFQPIYNRDGVIAFHGSERGLETFSRALLLQSAAIDPVRLADARQLRDLAWADLPYICVRDDIGDRWFANVRVPTVNVRANRTKYMARVEITETTTTPYAVDP